MVGALIFYTQRSPQAPEGPATASQAGAPASAVSDRAAQVPSASGPSWKEIDDPTQDGWDTEVLASKAKKQLDVLAQIISRSGKIDRTAIEKLITSDFASEPLLPTHLGTVLENEHLKVLRHTNGDAAESRADKMPHNGAEGLITALRAATEPFAGASDVRYKVKVFRVIPASGEVTTRQFVSISGRTKTGTIEQNATWDVGWKLGTDGTKPRMRWLRVVDFEQVQSSLPHVPEGTLFADCTRSVLGKNPCYADQFLRGINHWFSRLQDRSPWEVLGNPGLTVGDVNGDGLEDIYVCQEGSLPNRLFIQNPDGTATDCAASWGVDWLQSSRSSLLIDFDNDGDQDLVVAIHGAVVFAENVENGHFQRRDVLATSNDTMSLSAVDYDLDGRLDVYVCAYNKDRGQEASDGGGFAGAAADFVVHDANDGATNTLFHNQIGKDVWKFEDVTKAVGLDSNNRRYSLAASWDDFDNDGDQDLYVANDYGRDNFYRNDLMPSTAGKGGVRRFVDISATAGAEDSASGMSVTWGDYDRDGWMDVFVSNMWSSAGNRITYQNSFQPKEAKQIKRRFQRLARGNTLLQNQGDGTFTDQAAPAGVEMGRWAWGTRLADINNDGWQDVVIANGFITTEDTGDL